jgi:hypothetical protein
MNAANAIITARAHLDNAPAEYYDVAKFCLAMAESWLERDNEECAKRRALLSLSYSVGIFSIAYGEASL